MATATSIQPLKMTFEEFLAWGDEDTWAEWVNGEVILLMPASSEHQRIVKFIAVLLELWVNANQLGIVYFAPFLMRIASARVGREPDVLFIAEVNRLRLQANFLDGPADLVVEVISPESRTRDRETKFREYQQSGVREYWLVDPERRQAEFYRLDAQGVYQRADVGADSIYHSAVIEGFWLDVNWLWQPEPLLDILRAWEMA